MRNSFYITTPIYYVNDKPHIGHAYTTIAADILARYYRMKGLEVFFLTGTDEHGQKVKEAAQLRNITPKEHVDEMHKAFKGLWGRLNISNDDFIRTTEKRHIKVVKNILDILYRKGEIYKKSYEGWYCLSDERFWTEKDLRNNKCPECGKKVEFIKEWNYFFKMGKYREWLIAHINSNPNFIKPDTRKNEVLGFLGGTLNDLCISRPKERLSWGVPLPFDEKYVTYVWFDALINYISAPGYTVDDDNFNKWWPADHHIVGKDILTTHCVYWSTMLHAAGIPLPKNIFAHGWWTVEGEKISKSKGNCISPNSLIDEYGIDAVRYFLMREVPFGLDGDYSEDSIIARINSDLANNLGNLLSRTIKMTKSYFDSIIPKIDRVDDSDTILEKKGTDAINYVATHMPSLSFSRILSNIWELIDETNRYIDSNAPWALAKNEKGRGRLKSVIFNSLESLRLIAHLITPFMPDTGKEILSQLGIEGSGGSIGNDVLRWGGLSPGIEVKAGRHLFSRVESKKKEEKMETKKDKLVTDNIVVDIKEFMNVELKVGEVKDAEKIEKSKKLLKLKIDIGSETRQVVAGIAESYLPEELLGKRLAFVSNLKPAKLMGVESQGMILAAEGTDGKLSLLSFDKDVKLGSRIK